MGGPEKTQRLKKCSESQCSGLHVWTVQFQPETNPICIRVTPILFYQIKDTEPPAVETQWDKGTCKSEHNLGNMYHNT